MKLNILKKVFSTYVDTVWKTNVIFVFFFGIFVSFMVVMEPLFFSEIIKKIEIKRLGFKEEPVYGDDTIVFDVGFGEFDHHQKYHKKHEDGSSYCALSLL